MSESEAKMLAALSRRYKPPAWSFLAHVPNGTGMVKSRTMDALAMSLWPSRGLELFGFELKASRGDWLREARDPEKAEETFSYCHRRVLMVMPGVLHDEGEVPPAWGIFEYKGGKVFTIRKPPEQEPVAIDYAFLAAILRCAQETMVPRDAVKALADRRVEEEVKRAVKREQRSAGRLYEDERIAQKAIDKFEAASGLRILEWDAGNVGDAVRALMECRRHGKDWRLRAAPEALREAANAVEAALAAIVGEDGQDG